MNNNEQDFQAPISRETIINKINYILEEYKPEYYTLCVHLITLKGACYEFRFGHDIDELINTANYYINESNSNDSEDHLIIDYITLLISFEDLQDQPSNVVSKNYKVLTKLKNKQFIK